MLGWFLLPNGKRDHVRKEAYSMKKMLCLIAVLALAISMFVPAFAAEDDFVPSISYKDGPTIDEAEMNGGRMEDCLVVTSLKAAAEKTTDIPQEVRDLLLDVYDKLLKGELTIPMPEDYIVRELVDISWEETTCIQPGHTHEEELKQEGVAIKIQFDLSIKPENELLVFAYHNGQWDPVEIVKVNEDGSVICLFEHFCPVAFCVKNEKNTDPTSDLSAENLLLWIVMLSVSTAAVVVMSVNRRKFVR